MTLNGEVALILRYFTEFSNGLYFALFKLISVRCCRKTILLGLTLPRFLANVLRYVRYMLSAVRLLSVCL